MSETRKRAPFGQRLSAGLREGVDWASGNRDLRVATRQATDAAVNAAHVREYIVVYTHGRSASPTWIASVPDLPGCAASGETRDEAERNIRAAIERHLELMRAEGTPAPEPSAEVGSVMVAA